jgi:hypothetical protein
MASHDPEPASLLALPSEIRTSILEYVFDDNLSHTGLTTHLENGHTIARHLTWHHYLPAKIYTSMAASLLSGVPTSS